MGDLCNRKLTKQQLQEQEQEEEFASEPTDSEAEEEESESEEESKESKHSFQSNEGSDNEKHFSSSQHQKKEDNNYDCAFKPKQGLTIEEFSKLKDASQCFGCKKLTTDLGVISFLHCQKEINKHRGYFCRQCILEDFMECDVECIKCKVISKTAISAYSLSIDQSKKQQSASFLPTFLKNNAQPTLEDVKQNYEEFKKIDPTRQKLVLAQILKPMLKGIVSPEYTDGVTNSLLNLQQVQLTDVMKIFLDNSLLTKIAKNMESQLKQHDFETTGEYGSLVHMDLRQTSKTTNEDQQ